MGALPVIWMHPEIPPPDEPPDDDASGTLIVFGAILAFAFVFVVIIVMIAAMYGGNH